MPKIRVNGAELYYEEQGSGPETIVFAHGLIRSGRMFADQVNALKDRYRSVTFDDQLDQINVPTLIMVGDQDVAIVPAKAECIHARIADSRLHVIPGAGHTSTVEEPDVVNSVIMDFLTAQRQPGLKPRASSSA